MFSLLGSRLSRLVARSARPRKCWTGCVLIVSLLFVGPPSAPSDKETGRRADKEKQRPPSVSASSRSRVALLGHAETWKRLPPVERGADQPLPVWARALASTLPHTTAAMLELDFRHRVQSPLEPALRGRLRWIAAHENGCRYSEAYAAADLRRAGMDEASIRQLAGELETLPDDIRAAAGFARKLTREGSSVTDAEVEQLLARYGERQVVAMVLLLAYASFQDRLILALDLPLEDGGPLPPVEVRFTPRRLGVSRAAPPRKAPARAAATLANMPVDTEWLRLDFADIQKQLADQRLRRCRIALPGDNPQAPRWGLVCRAYQPELADAWTACAHAFGDEANQDPIFEESVFWIVTRTVGCFY
jgi:alkylhydroperoxidase family enzyme